MWQVKQSQPADKSVIDVASDLTTGDDSELNKLIQSGDVSSAFQLAKAAIVAVDDDKKTRPVSQDQLLEERKKVDVSRIIISKRLFTFIYLFIYLQTSPRGLDTSQGKLYYEVQKKNTNN